MTLKDSTGINPERKIVRRIRIVKAQPFEHITGPGQPSLSKQPEKAQENFWDYSSGKVTIDEEKLFDYLFKKGYRYFKLAGENYKWIVIFTNNKVEVLLQNKLWKLCCHLIDKDFLSVAEEERTEVKAGLKEGRKSLKRKRLVQLKNEDLERCEATSGKSFLLNQNIKSKNQEGVAS